MSHTSKINDGYAIAYKCRLHEWDMFPVEFSEKSRPLNDIVICKNLMKTHERLQHERKRMGLSKMEVSQALGITEMHVYDLEAYENELETTLNICQIYQLAGLLKITPGELCTKSERCHLSEKQTFTNISQLIRHAGLPLEKLSEKIGWELGTCTKSIANMKKQPLDFFEDFANWFKVPLESVLPNIEDI